MSHDLDLNIPKASLDFPFLISQMQQNLSLQTHGTHNHPDMMRIRNIMVNIRDRLATMPNSYEYPHWVVAVQKLDEIAADEQILYEHNFHQLWVNVYKQPSFGLMNKRIYKQLFNRTDMQWIELQRDRYQTDPELVKAMLEDPLEFTAFKREYRKFLLLYKPEDKVFKLKTGTSINATKRNSRKRPRSRYNSSRAINAFRPHSNQVRQSIQNMPPPKKRARRVQSDQSTNVPAPRHKPTHYMNAQVMPTQSNDDNNDYNNQYNDEYGDIQMQQVIEENFRMNNNNHQTFNGNHGSNNNSLSHQKRYTHYVNHGDNNNSSSHQTFNGNHGHNNNLNRRNCNNSNDYRGQVTEENIYMNNKCETFVGYNSNSNNSLSHTQQCTDNAVNYNKSNSDYNNFKCNEHMQTIHDYDYDYNDYKPTLPPIVLYDKKHKIKVSEKSKMKKSKRSKIINTTTKSMTPQEKSIFNAKKVIIAIEKGASLEDVKFVNAKLIGVGMIDIINEEEDLEFPMNKGAKIKKCIVEMFGGRESNYLINAGQTNSIILREKRDNKNYYCIDSLKNIIKDKLYDSDAEKESEFSKKCRQAMQSIMNGDVPDLDSV